MFLHLFLGNPETKVAFSVHVGNENKLVLNVGSLLVYKTVLINIGNGYNKNSGAFTSPVRGIYFFMLSFMTYGTEGATGRNQGTTLGIYVNDEALCTAYESGSTIPGAGRASCSAMKELNVGDVVNVKALYRGAALHPENQGFKNQNALVGFLYKAL